MLPDFGDRNLRPIYLVDQHRSIGGYCVDTDFSDTGGVNPRIHRGDFMVVRRVTGPLPQIAVKLLFP